MSAASQGRGQLQVFSGTANPELAGKIAAHLGVPLGGMTVSKFPDGETCVRIDTSVRGKDAYIVQPTCPPVNDNLVELLIILDALRRASASRITAVIPYYGYARQDKKTAGREPIAARMVADMLTTVGADRIVTVDLHSPQIQGFFDIPVDHLTAVGVLAEHLRKSDLTGSVIVAPDAGRVNMATDYANRLGLPVVIIHKRRIGPEETEAVYVVGDVAGKRPIIIDDMVTTGGTISRSVRALMDEGAAPPMRVAVTHGVLVGKAVEHLSEDVILEAAVTDTVPIGAEKAFDRLKVVSIAPLIAEAIRRIHADSSVSELFS